MQGFAYVFICICFGLGGALIAHVKGNPRLIWFAICAVLPFVGIIAAIASRSEVDEPRRRCDRCGRVMAVSETLCMSCGADLDFPDEQLPSIREEYERGRG